MPVSFDQHVLTDPEVIKRLIEAAAIKKDDVVVEIGAGSGAITKGLAGHGRIVTAFELDAAFKPALETLKADNPGLSIRYLDALEVSWKGVQVIVGNIPFSMSEPLLHKAIRSGVERISVIVSESFKQNLVSEQTMVGMVAALFFTVEPVMWIERTAFEPQPRTDCWIVALTARAPASEVERIMREVVKGDGKTKNALRRAFVITGKTKNEARDAIEQLHLDEASLEKSVKQLSWHFYARLRKALAETLEIQ